MSHRFPLLAAIAAICVYVGRWPALLSIGFLAFTFGVFSPRTGIGSPGRAHLPSTCHLLASALAISLLICRYQSSTSAHRAEVDARLIVESMPGLAWSADPDGNFKYVNQSVTDYVGTPREDLGRIEGSDDFGWRRVVHPDDVDHAVELWLHCLKTGEPYEAEHRIRRVDGIYRWFCAAIRNGEKSK